MMPEPMAASSVRCQMRNAAPATGMPTKAPASRLSRTKSPAGRVRSIRSRKISGVSSPRPMVARMLSSSRTIRTRYGRA